MSLRVARCCSQSERMERSGYFTISPSKMSLSVVSIASLIETVTFKPHVDTSRPRDLQKQSFVAFTDYWVLAQGCRSFYLPPEGWNP